jgi:hypothetical protein
VLQLAGREEDAAASLREAIELFERKGSLAEVSRARERLTMLDAR